MIYVLAIVQCLSRHFFTIDIENFHISYHDHLYHDIYSYHVYCTSLISTKLINSSWYKTLQVFNKMFFLTLPF